MTSQQLKLLFKQPRDDSLLANIIQEITHAASHSFKCSQKKYIQRSLVHSHYLKNISLMIPYSLTLPHEIIHTTYSCSARVFIVLKCHSGCNNRFVWFIFVELYVNFIYYFFPLKTTVILKCNSYLRWISLCPVFLKCHLVFSWKTVKLTYIQYTVLWTAWQMDKTIYLRIAIMKNV